MAVFRLHSRKFPILICPASLRHLDGNLTARGRQKRDWFSSPYLPLLRLLCRSQAGCEGKRCRVRNIYRRSTFTSDLRYLVRRYVWTTQRTEIKRKHQAGGYSAAEEKPQRPLVLGGVTNTGPTPDQLVS